MERSRIDDIRRRAESGEGLDVDDVRAVLDALASAQRAAALPAEYVVRVARTESDLDRWQASHPLLLGTVSAPHPADALALASVELRRALSLRLAGRGASLAHNARGARRRRCARVHRR